MHSVHLRPWFENTSKTKGSGGILVTAKGTIHRIYASRKDQIIVVDTYGIRIFAFYLSPSRAKNHEAGLNIVRKYNK